MSCGPSGGTWPVPSRGTAGRRRAPHGATACTSASCWSSAGSSSGMPVLNVRRHGVPKGAVVIMRPSKWGNRFLITPSRTREQVIEMYRQDLWARIKSGQLTIEEQIGRASCRERRDADDENKWVDV